MRAVLIFCEGNHDVVFVSRSLGAITNCIWLSCPIRELPSPLGPKIDPKDPGRFIFGSLITGSYRAQVQEDLQIRPAAHAPAPTFEAVLQNPAKSTLYVIIRCNGDSAPERSIKLIDDFYTLFPLRPAIREIASAFLFDADAAGVSAREASFAAEYSRCLLPGATVPHATWLAGKYGPAGLFVFHDPKTRTGTLEDSLAPMVESQWKQRWDAAGHYLTTHAQQSDPVSKKIAERHKAQISVTGQFLFPGDPMTNVLERKGLDQKHFTGPASQTLIDFLLRAF